MIDVNTSADRLYGYCVEADKGPVMVPTFCASSQEAKRIFGIDFLPHFYQNPTGIVICRVEFDNMAKGKVEFEAYPLNDQGAVDTAGTPFKVLKVEATSEGPCEDRVVINKSSSGSGYNVAITTSVTSKTYQNVPSLEKIVSKINSRFGKYLHAELSNEYKAQVKGTDTVAGKKFLRDQFIFATSDNVLTYGKLIGGSNGTMRNTDGSPASKPSTYNFVSYADAEGNEEYATGSVKLTGITDGDYTQVEVVENSIDGFTGNKYYIASDAQPNGSIYPLYTNAGTTEAGIFVKIEIGEVEGVEVTDPVNGISKTISENPADDETNPEVTRTIAYQKAFQKIQDVDLIGIATIVDSPAVQSALALHIDEVTDPEVHQLRFGITGATGYVVEPDNGTELSEENQMTFDKLSGQANILDSEWMIYIGQGVVFEDEYGNRRNVLPHEATQLYTGIRSALGYAEAIFGGEQKKVLKGVVDTLPVVTDGSDITKELIEDLNESGVCTFKKEYSEITFIEGVTTVQDRDVLSYENMMSIVAYVSKRLIKVAKPYQGQVLTEDLKSTLTTALLKELKDITETDGTLMELEDFNIPPYNVKVEAATKTMFDDSNNLIRVSKIIIKCRIVPVGALRDIDLGIIAI